MFFLKDLAFKVIELTVLTATGILVTKVINSLMEKESEEGFNGYNTPH